IDLTSPPAQKALSPAPRTTTQPTSREPAASSSASSNIVIISRLKAFIASGRLNTIFMTPSSTDFSRSGLVLPPGLRGSGCDDRSGNRLIAPCHSVLLGGTFSATPPMHFGLWGREGVVELLFQQSDLQGLQE